jgi:hypothetical protein
LKALLERLSEKYPIPKLADSEAESEARQRARAQMETDPLDKEFKDALQQQIILINKFFQGRSSVQSFHHCFKFLSYELANLP